jgi:hypothetical protein
MRKRAADIGPSARKTRLARCGVQMSRHELPMWARAIVLLLVLVIGLPIILPLGIMAKLFMWSREQIWELLRS